MYTMVSTWNGAGRAFVDFALPMLVQSSVLILILLAVDAVLRRKVRAVFRYWIWLLVLVKLVLPPSLGSPVSLGTWFGDQLEVPAAVLLEPRELPPREPPSHVANLLWPPDPLLAEPPLLPPRAAPAVPSATDDRAKATVVSPPPPVSRPPAVPLSWQGLVLLVWAVIVAALLLLLAQRAFFVRGLVGQAAPASRTMLQELAQCRRRLGLRREIGLRLSLNATTPAVCGLVRPVILMPQNLAPRLHDRDLQAVLLHELAHVSRGDLWINFAQTLLQIVYFYHPLLWLANAIIRRIREQAVDETVLVAMGESAPQYPQTLLNVAKLALARPPALSLRLLGVVESKSALTGRIRHILSRPIPKTARLGLFGLLVVFVIAAVLLPMAKGSSLDRWFHRDRLVQFETDERPTGTYRQLGRDDVYSKEYQVTFRKGERLLVVAELYQTGRPMQTLGHRVFPATTRPEKLAVRLRRQYGNAEKTAIRHDVRVSLGREAFHLENVRVETPRSYADTHWGFFTGTELKDTGPRPYHELENLLLFASGAQRDTSVLPFTRIWIPGYNNVTWVFDDVYFILVKMLPLSQLDHLQVGAPELGYPEQLPDGSLLPGDAPKERRQVVADEYVLNLQRALLRDRMPLPELAAHRYYQAGDPIYIQIKTKGSSWKPRYEDLPVDDRDASFILMDGKEHYLGALGGPFSEATTSRQIDITDYLRHSLRQDPLTLGRHTLAYGWKDVDVVDPNDSGRRVPFARLVTDPVEFELVEQLPPDYYRPVYQEGWDQILRANAETPFSDDPGKHHVAGPLLTLGIRTLPFDVAFEVYAQAEGSEQRQYAAQVAIKAGSVHHITDCSRKVEGLNWDTVGDKRWRLILVPSEKVATENPPIHEFYGREFITDWVAFERSPRFEQNRLTAERAARLSGRMSWGARIQADRPVDLDNLSRRWSGGVPWPLPPGYDLGWTTEGGGTLRLDPNSAVRMLWFPQANARLIEPDAQTRQQLAGLRQSPTRQVVPPEGEPTLIAVLSSEGKVYFVRVTKTNETLARLDWWEDEGENPGLDSRAAQDVSRDSDGDGLSDFQEIHKYRTDPAKQDSDGDGTPDGDWNERREYTYSVRTVLRYLLPFAEKGLNDDFQDGRVLKQTDEYVEVEFIHYPFATGEESILENRNWRQDDAQMTEYLAPGPSTNWDEQMQRDLIAALKADGIDIETLSDKQVVQQVSRWLLRRSRSLDKAFTTWFVHFPQGKPAVYPGLEDAFRREFERDSGNYDWTLDQHFDHEVLGRGMFYHKTYGSCTSTAVYLTTVLRALGIPTRMVLVAPAVDASDREQILMVKNAITHHRVRMTMLPGLNRASRGTTNHIFNEVYVGNRWCRLDYNQLGCSNFGLHRFGLQTHLYTFQDLSDANLAPTWGRRYAKGEHDDVFRHSNPYTAVEVSELFGPHGQIPNPPCTAQELDPHPQPDVFLFYPPRAEVWDPFNARVGRTVGNRTGRYHDRESYENLFDGIWLVRPQDYVILCFSLDTPQRAPAGYEDLLLKSWAEIESQLRQGQTVELSGKARDLNVIVLAASAAEELKPLVQNSKVLEALGGHSPSPSAGPSQTQATPSSAGQPGNAEKGTAVARRTPGADRVVGIGPAWRTLRNALGGRYRGSIGGFSTDDRKCAEYFEQVLSGTGPGDTLVLMFAFDEPAAVPASYRDLLPLPWSEIESRAQQGQTLEARGTARGLNVVLLAAPTFEQLNTLVRRTHLLDPFRPDDETPAVSRSSPARAQLPNGMTVELIGLAEHPSVGQPWWRPDGAALPVRPYDRLTSTNSDPTYKQYELVYRIANTTDSVITLLRSTDQIRGHSGPHPVKDAAQIGAARDIEGLFVGIISVEREAVQTRVDVGLGSQENWQTRCALESPVDKAMATSKGILLGPAVEKGNQTNMTFSYQGLEDEIRLIAVDKDGTRHQTTSFSRVSGARFSRGQAAFHLHAAEIASIQFQTQTFTWVQFQNVSLSPDLRTQVKAEYVAPPPSGVIESPAGGGWATGEDGWIVLPEADRQPVLLDLATGAFVGMPYLPPGTPTSEIWQAIKKLGQGDLLYDQDMGDHTLILFRDARSAQAQEYPGEPPLRSHLIGRQLPVTLTVTTAEGRSYEVTILAANDQTCTLKYTPVPTGQGAGGGALVEPEKADSVPAEREKAAATLELRIAPTGSRSRPTWLPQETAAGVPALSGRVVDPDGRPVAGAQVALCTKDKGVIIQEGQLVPTTWGGRTSAIVDTDAQGRFAFSTRPEEFHIVAAHEQGFAWVTDKELTGSGDLRLVPWARIAGTLRIGRELGVGERVSLLNFINKNAIDQGVHFEYRVETDAAGRFAFERVPPTWMEVGYMVRVGDSMWTDTSRTPIHLQPGQSLKMTLGGEGRPVVGRFVPPADYQGPVYFGAGLRAFATQRPDLPRPADYDRMTQRQQQEWLKQWSKTPEAEAFYNVRWHDLNRRHYSFRIENDGLFRIEDVIPGEYQFTVWLEERFSGSGHPQEIGGYSGPVDVPPLTETYTDEPLDLGDLTLKMRNPPLHVGDPAPLFETQTLDGNDIRLLDYRGKFVLLSFWQPTFHPELDRLKELQQTYGPDRLAILDFAGSDTLAEVRKYIAEHQIEWPEIYLGETKDHDIAKRYGDPVASYILLVDPEGKIVATWLRGEKLTNAVTDALGNSP